jgi:hypothetical protein
VRFRRLSNKSPTQNCTTRTYIHCFTKTLNLDILKLDAFNAYAGKFHCFNVENGLLDDWPVIHLRWRMFQDLYRYWKTYRGTADDDGGSVGDALPTMDPISIGFNSCSQSAEIGSQQQKPANSPSEYNISKWHNMNSSGRLSTR